MIVSEVWKSKLSWTLQWAPSHSRREAGWALSHCPCPAPHTQKLTGLRKQWNKGAAPRESCTRPAGEHTWTLPGLSKFTPYFCRKRQGALKYSEIFPLSKKFNNLSSENHRFWPSQPLHSLDSFSQTRKDFLWGFCGLKVTWNTTVQGQILLQRFWLQMSSAIHGKPCNSHDPTGKAEWWCNAAIPINIGIFF